VLRECLSSFTSEECVALLSRNQIVVGAVRSYRQVLDSADVQASGMLVDAVASDGSRYASLALPYTLGQAPRPTPSAAPACGADTDRVLGALGFDADEIARLHGIGAVA